jgi:hypothetical protein
MHSGPALARLSCVLNACVADGSSAAVSPCPQALNMPFAVLPFVCLQGTA